MTKMGPSGRFTTVMGRLVTATLIVTSGLALPALTSSDTFAVESESSNGAIDLFVQEGSIVAPGQEATVRVTLRALEASPIPERAVRLSITEEPLVTETALRRYLNREADPVLTEIDTVFSPEVLELETGDVRIPVVAPGDPEAVDQEPQIFGLQADLFESPEATDGEPLLSNRQMLIVVPTDSLVPPTPVAPIVTLTVPPTGGQPLSKEELEAYTAAGGPLDAVAGVLRRHPATIAVDSRIILSVQALAEDAPPSAEAWVSDLEDLGFAQFALPWADADPLAALEIDSLLYARLGQYPWLHSPEVTSDQLDLLAQRSAEAVLVPSSVVTSDRTVIQYGQTTMIRVDEDLSSELVSAVVASSEVEAEAALQRVQGLVAKRAFSQTGEVLVVDTGRLPATATALRLEDVLTRLENVTYVDVVGVPLGADPNELALGINESAPERAWSTFVDQVFELWNSDVRYSIIASNPELAIVERWNRYLALFSSAWRNNTQGRLSEWERALDDSAAFQNSVWIEQGSSITVLADRTELPVTIRNSLPTPVHVELVVKPTRGLLRVEQTRVDVQVPANSFQRVGVPVRSLANGVAPVEISLNNALGEQVGETISIQVTVRAGWESVITISLAVVIIAVFAFGLYRAIQRRIRQRHEEAEVNRG